MLLIHLINIDMMLKLTQGQGHKVKGQGQMWPSTTEWGITVIVDICDKGIYTVKKSSLCDVSVHPSRLVEYVVFKL